MQGPEGAGERLVEPAWERTWGAEGLRVEGEAQGEVGQVVQSLEGGQEGLEGDAAESRVVRGRGVVCGQGQMGQ